MFTRVFVYLGIQLRKLKELFKDSQRINLAYRPRPENRGNGEP